MRIENKPLLSTFSPRSSSSLPGDRVALSSIQSMSWKSFSVWNIAIFVKRKVFNFFRAILSFFLPVGQREKVKPAEIEYSKILGEEGEFTYQILLNGFKTNNEVRFKKEKDALVLLELHFQDPEMREHMGMILDKVMRQENTGSMGVKRLDIAQVLWNCGFKSKDTIYYNPENQDERNSEIRRVIENAKGKEPILNNHYLSALQRVERRLEGEEEGMMNSFIQLCASRINHAPKKVELSMSDLLILSELKEIGALKAIEVEQAPLQFKQGAVLTQVGNFQEIEGA